MLSKITSESKIVFFDLDNTLFDNLKIRHDAIVPALKRLDLNRGIEELLGKYEQIVDLSDTLEFIGLTNFKHIWNRSELYAILTILFTDNESQRNAFGVTRSEQNLFLDKLNEINESFLKIKREYPFDEVPWDSLLNFYKNDLILD